MRKPTGINPRLVDQHMRVVLPKEVVAALQLGCGSHVHFAVLPDGRVEVRRVRLMLE